MSIECSLVLGPDITASTPLKIIMIECWWWWKSLSSLSWSSLLSWSWPSSLPCWPEQIFLLLNFLLCLSQRSLPLSSPLQLVHLQCTHFKSICIYFEFICIYFEYICIYFEYIYIYSDFVCIYFEYICLYFEFICIYS